ncbi:MAG: hypothetical protein V8R99_00510 [Eubacterium ventriosum]|uniref:hypothetical protein n=1 Tax=Eubacterium ventriosum TaxID=39496 RepID=UPI00300EE502
MRKPLALMLAGLMAVSMVGCGSNGDAAEQQQQRQSRFRKGNIKGYNNICR